MSLVLDARGVGGLDVDYSRATQLSTIGSLADAVLRELIVLEAGAIAVDQLVAVPAATSIFRSAATEYAHPRSIWDAHSVVDDLVHLSSPVPDAVDTSSEPADADVQPWLVGIADALDAVMAPVPDPDALELVRGEFTQISQSTMRSAARIVGGHLFLA